jgi:gliding motility-associated-like protein
MRNLFLILLLFCGYAASAQFTEVEMTIYAPNSFTPNNDGVNDCWYVETYGNWEEFEIIIFTKWGERIWKTNNPEECWIGNVTIKDSNGFFYVEDEMYFYKIFARKGVNVKNYTGTVTVLR